MEGDGMVVCPNVFYTVLNPLLWAGSQVSCVIITISVILNHINYLFLYATYIYIYIILKCGCRLHGVTWLVVGLDTTAVKQRNKKIIHDAQVTCHRQIVKG